MSITASTQIKFNKKCTSFYLGRDDTPGVEDSSIWLDAEYSRLNHAEWILADLVVEVLIFGAWSSGDDRLNVLLLRHVVAKLVGVVRVTLHRCRRCG